ncbi:serine--tRNA ligase [Paracoccaceae bacterium]|nr:serine--tRNA ligase [Paracoccaceae bacterium]
MHDIKIIRKDPKNFDLALKKRGEKPKSEVILELDFVRRSLIESLEKNLAMRKSLSKKIGSSNANYGHSLLKKVKDDTKKIKVETSKLEKKLEEIEAKLKNLMLSIPNLLNNDVPEGKGEEDNIEMYNWGEIKESSFPEKEHYEVPAARSGISFSDAAKVSGSRFVFLSGSIALLHRALTQYMLNTNIIENSLKEVWAPVLVTEQSMIGTGQLPKFEEDSYKTNEGLWLVPTAEVPLTNLGKDNIYLSDSLPIRMTAATQCFRSEAGSAGKDTTGMIRQHQFEKVEMVTFCTPESQNIELERMTNCAEKILKNLCIPYRKILLCSGDTGFGSRKTYDLEVWLPGQKRYREISSCSICGDFQSRRINIRFRKNKTSKPEFLSTLNGSGLAVGRCLVAVIENYQCEDGSISIPSALRPYMFNHKKIDYNGILI